MQLYSRLATTALVIVSCLTALSCSSPEESACENLERLRSETGDGDGEMADQETCMEAMRSMKEDCGSEGEAVVKCIADIDGRSREAVAAAMRECTAMCQR